MFFVTYLIIGLLSTAMLFALGVGKQLEQTNKGKRIEYYILCVGISVWIWPVLVTYVAYTLARELTEIEKSNNINSKGGP